MEVDRAGRWLRNIKDGEIYGWDEILAENPLTEEVTEEQAFPEKFIPKKQKGRKTKVKLKTEVIPEDEKAVNMELAEEATKGIDKKK